MNHIQEVTAELITAVKDSEEYSNYAKLKEDMTKYPLLKEKVDEFRKKNYELQNSLTDIFEEADKLLQEYEEILVHPIVKGYLDSENALCRVLQQINWQMIEALEFEADLEQAGES